MLLLISVFVNKFICPNCSVQSELNIDPPLFIRCSSCGTTYQIDKEKNTTAYNIEKRFLQPINTIALGANGVYKDLSFQIIGHIRSINSSSISNEWLMKFYTGTELWLIENGSSYFVFESVPIIIPSNLIKGQKVGSIIDIQSTEYRIVDLSKQVEFQMEGQIPENSFNDDNYFKFEAIANNGTLASICVFDKEIVEAFTGVAIELAELKLSTLTKFNNWI